MDRIKNISDFFRMYVEGFKNMTWGKTLWIIIFIKLFVMFAILRLFLFPNFLNTKFKTDAEKAEYVATQLTE
jgi:uncharacterized Rmd1/YagE family protein